MAGSGSPVLAEVIKLHAVVAGVGSPMESVVLAGIGPTFLAGLALSVAVFSAGGLTVAAGSPVAVFAWFGLSVAVLGERRVGIMHLRTKYINMVDARNAPGVARVNVCVEWGAYINVSV